MESCNLQQADSKLRFTFIRSNSRKIIKIGVLYNSSHPISRIIYIEHEKVAANEISSTAGLHDTGKARERRSYLCSSRAKAKIREETRIAYNILNMHNRTTKQKNLKTQKKNWMKFAVVLFQILKLIGVSGQHGCQAHPPSENRRWYRGHGGFWLLGYQRGQTCMHAVTGVVLGTSLCISENKTNFHMDTLPKFDTSNFFNKLINCRKRKENRSPGVG